MNTVRKLCFRIKRRCSDNRITRFHLKTVFNIIRLFTFWYTSPTAFVRSRPNEFHRFEHGHNMVIPRKQDDDNDDNDDDDDDDDDDTVLFRKFQHLTFLGKIHCGTTIIIAMTTLPHPIPVRFHLKTVFNIRF